MSETTEHIHGAALMARHMLEVVNQEPTPHEVYDDLHEAIQRARLYVVRRMPGAKVSSVADIFDRLTELDS